MGIFIIILIAVASYILPRNLGNLDELWIYNSAKNIVVGLLPYKDFNLVTTPFLPILASSVLKVIGNELIVMRGLSIILCTCIVFMLAKIMKKLKIKSYLIYIALIGITLLLKEHFCIDYNFINLFLILCITYLEILQWQKENKIKNSIRIDFAIGILAGMTIGFKQTTGIVILILAIANRILIARNKADWKEVIKILITRIVGALVPIGLLSIYLSFSHLWGEFVNYTILGVKEFTNVIPYTNLFKNSNMAIKMLASILPIILIYMYFVTVAKNRKTENEQKLFYIFCYSVASLVVIFPISDEIHFLIGIIPTIIGIVYIIQKIIIWIRTKIKKEKIKIFIKEFVKCGVIIGITLITLENVRNISDYSKQIKQQKTFDHYSYIPISDGIYSRIEAVDEYIRNQEKKVYILDASAVVFKIPMDQYDKNYDLFLKGNLGQNGSNKMIDHIKKLDNEQILIQKSSRNWQTPEDVVEFVQKNWNKVGEVDMFEIYEK